MRQLNLFLFLVSTIIFTSCNSDDDSSVTYDPSLIVGQWDLNSFNSENGSIDYSLGLITSTSPISVTGKEYDMTVTFNENPNEVISDGSFVIETEFDVADVENPEDETIEGFFDADNWSLNGDILTITETGRSSSLELQSYLLRLCD